MKKTLIPKIPDQLVHWINAIIKALPLRSIPTFLELLLGAMMTKTGFITDVQLMVNAQKHWTTYYKWLEKGIWSYLHLAVALAKLIVHVFKDSIFILIIDDSLVARSSKKAPGCKIHHQHAHKPNRPTFMLGQCWVSLSVAIGTGSSIPVLHRLIDNTGNTSKLAAMNVLLRVMLKVFPKKTTYVSADCWYMRKNVILKTLQTGFHTVGQVRIDTALFDLPSPYSGKGRPRKYGKKYSAEVINQLPIIRTVLDIYGKKRRVHYRTAMTKARFLDGLTVKAVWVQIENTKGKMSKPHLILSTDTHLSAEQVIAYYAKRWTTEPMFNLLKNSWGLNTAWQQSKQTLCRWVQILTIALAFPQMLVEKGNESTTQLVEIPPWRDEKKLTAGIIRQGLTRTFYHVAIRTCWDRKQRKFKPPGYEDMEQTCDQFLKSA